MAMLTRFHESFQIIPKSDRYMSQQEQLDSEQTPIVRRRDLPQLRTTFGLFDENFLYKYIEHFSKEVQRNKDLPEFLDKSET